MLEPTIKYQDRESAFGISSASILVNVEDDSCLVVSYSGYKMPKYLMESFIKLYPRYKKARAKFKSDLLIASNKRDNFIDKRSEAYLWLVANFKSNWSQSPYSESFYSAEGITWDYKPEGSLRLSDHWNFMSKGKVHCATTNPNFKQGWAVGKYKDGKYEIVKVF